MDANDTWPAPWTADDRGVHASAARQPEGAWSPGAATETGRTTGHAERPRPREKLISSLLVIIPLLSAVVVVLGSLRYSHTGNGLWLGLVAVVLVLGAVSWGVVLRRSFTTAQGRLAARLLGYGVGIIREADVESPFDEDGVSDTVAAHLTLRINPTQGPAFTGTVDAVYRTSDAEKLTVGAHGPVRYLRSDPEATVAIETRMDRSRVQRIYRAAAMN